ncbi:hypothetical protein TNCV_4287021 [Trichonephila clavipes]|nr:hypothetical protein TNCV_4287021 [Trichonephila clavipes]
MFYPTGIDKRRKQKDPKESRRVNLRPDRKRKMPSPPKMIKRLNDKRQSPSSSKIRKNRDNNKTANDDSGFVAPKKTAKKTKISVPFIAGTSQPVNVLNKFSSLSEKEDEINPTTSDQTAAPISARSKALALTPLGGRGSLVVKVTDSWPACHEFEPSTTEHPPCTTALRVKSVEAQTPTRWSGVEIRRGDGQIRCRSWFKMTRCVAKSSRVFEKCDVNIYSLIPSELQ